MTYKNAKTILFASLIAAMILPFSGMMMAEAAPNNNANDNVKGKLHITDSKDNMGTEVAELNQYHKVLKDENSSQADKDNAANRMNEIKESLEQKVTMSNEKRDIIRGHIDDVSGVIDKLIRANVPVVLVGTDHENESLRIGIDREGLTDAKVQDIEQKIRAIVGENIDITIQYSDKIAFTACSQTGDCEPIQGGVKITPSGYTPCSMGYRATYGGQEGFITAGHCTSGNTGVDVGNPTGWWWDKIGSVTANGFDISTFCDCAFVSATEENVSSEIYDGITLSGTKFPDMYTWTFFEGHNTRGSYAGITDNYVNIVIGTVTVYGVVETNGYAEGGDSGGTVYEAFASGTPKFMGIITAAPDGGGSPSYYTPYYHIQNEFIGITFG